MKHTHLKLWGHLQSGGHMMKGLWERDDSLQIPIPSGACQGQIHPEPEGGGTVLVLRTF